MTIHPSRLYGNWIDGYALDYHTIHSEFLGKDEDGYNCYETQRTEIGQLLYELKY